MADSEAALIDGTVSAIEGSAFVRGSDGQVRRLEEGDTVKAGDVIITDASSSVEIVCSAESPFIVPEDTEFLATEECFSFEGDTSDNQVADETIAAVAAALESGGDLLDVLEATAAGGATGNNGHTFIRLGRIVLALSDGSTTTEEALLVVLEDVLGQADLLEQSPALVSIIGEYTIVEGDTSGAFVVLLNQAPESVGSDITVTLNYSGTAQDGTDFTGVSSVIIPAGSNAATFNIDTIEDALAEGVETFTVSIGAIDDTNFVTIEADPQANSVTNSIVDDTTPEPPIAADDSAETGVDASVVINVATNDSDPDGSLDLGSIVITQLPTNGSVVVNGDGTVIYTPNEGYVGPDTFQYTIADNDGAVSNVANVAVQVSDGRETAAFTDNWVNGVEYYAYATEEDYLQGTDPVASGLTGDRLDENGDPIMGSFSWADGEFVVFKIGDVIVAEFLAEQLTGDILFIHDIAGLALSNTNADQLENTAIFLQALDADLTDGDLSDGLSTNSTSNSEEAFTNGINISQEVRDAFVGYLDPTTGEALDLQEAGKVMISNALAILGIEFTRQSEVDPNPNDEGGNENVFETQAIEHVTDTVLALADTEEAGERLADDFAFDAREEDIIVAGNGEITYSSEFLDTEDGDPETARVSFNAAGLVANATPQQVAIVENMEIEIPAGTEAQITLADGTTRVVGTVVYDDETREGYIQLEPFVAGDGTTPDRGITNEEIVSGLLQSGGVSFVYTLWDWTASTTVSLDTVDTYRNVISLEGPSEVTEGETTTEYTVSLSQPIPAAEDGGTDIVVTLTYTYTTAEEGDIVETVSVAIPAGSASATFTIDTVADDLAEGREDFVVSITEANIQDENFSVVEVSDANSVTTTIVDDGASFTLELFAVVQVEGTDESPEFDYVKASEIAEDGGVAEYVVLLVDAEGNPVLDQPGGTVTINVGVAGDTANRGVDYESAATIVATVGTSFTIAAIDDALADSGELFTLALAEDWSLSDANPAVSYENSPVSTTILDETNNDPEVPEDNDSVTISLGDLAVDEGSGNATITGSLDAVPDEEFVVTLDNGATITFGTDYVVGTEVESTPFSIQDDDVFIDAETLALGVTSVTPGVFEAVNTDDSAQVVISDTIDASTATLSSAIVGDEDGATVTYTVTLSTAPTVDETFTFDVDGVSRSITVAAGQTTGITTVAYTDADVFIDVETVGIASNFAASDADGASNYESLSLTNNATGETLADSIDASTATLSSAIVGDEDGATVTYTVTLSTAPTVDETFTFDVDGVSRSITVAAGQTTGITTVAYTDADVFIDVETVGIASNFAASDADGASNYESLSLTNNATGETLADSIDASTATLSSAIVGDEDGATVTYTVTLSTAPTVDETFTFDVDGVSRSITVAAGQTTGITTVAYTDADVFIDVETVGIASNFAASDADGASNYESLSLTNNATGETLADSIDASTATLSSAIVGDEDGATVTYTVTLSTAPTVDETFTFDVDGVSRSITVAAGQTTGITTVAYTDADVFIDVETVGIASNFAASDADGASNYESLSLTNNATGETLADSIDASTATLSSAIVGDEDGATVTYTVTLSTAPTVDETFTFDVDGVSRSITVAAGQTTGITTVAYTDADVFIDVETVGIASNFAASDADGASNYESLSLTNNATGETLADSIDASTATLSSAIVGDEDGATVTYTVTLSTAPTVDETFTFDVDGVSRSITVAAGQTTGITTVAYTDADVFIDVETVGIASNFAASDADGASNYESLSLTNNATGETLADSIDASTATLSSAIVGDEDGATVTYTVTLSTAPTVDETFTFDVDGVSRSITVAAGQTTGITTVAYTDADVFIDVETVGIASNFAASDADGASNYESLSLTNNATGETLADSIDASTATLSSAIVGDEDGATVTYTVTLSTAPTVDETFTFDVDGVSRSITVAAGQTTGITTVAYTDADVFIDVETVGIASNFAASDADGASNYESLSLTNNATGETLADSIDASTATLSSAIVGDEDGATVTYTVTLSTAPTVDETFTFDVDGVSRSITVAAGQTTGITTVAYTDADVFIDVETVGIASNFAASDADGASNYESLSLTNNATGETLADSIDASTATLSSAIVGDEDGATVTYTVTLSTAPTVDETFTFDVDGVSRSITVAAGQTTGITTVAYTDADVFIDVETVGIASNFAASDADGASNYESLSLTNNATGETLADSIDASTATLSSAIVGDEDGATVTYTVTLSTAPTVDETFTFDVDGVSRSITVAAGQTTGITTVAYTDADVFIDVETVGIASNFAASDADGASNYESLSLTNNATGETLADSIDASTATLSSAIVGDEDGATVTYTVTLSTAPTVDETFTFDVDGVSRSITVAAGQTTGITTVAYTDADVFIDVETVGIASNFAASDADGASNYESLSLTNNATGETLADSIDASTATLSSAIVGDEDGATVTYTVTLSTAPTVDETFTFDVDGVSRSITVAAGQTTGITTVAYTDADVFIDVETVGIASNFAASDADGASNYESLSLTNNATGETLADSIDASTATLSSAIVGDEDGATVTYTVTLSTAPTVDETFTFDVDGVSRSITVAAGQTTGITTVAYTDADVFIDVETVGIASNFAASDADGASNYESLSLTNNATGETLADSIDASTATLSSAIVGDEDGATVTYTVTLSTAPTVDETFTFDVDGVSRSITVAAGQTTGITTVAYTDADVFIDVETVGIASNFAASDADGASNYESLSLTNNATGETLADSIDASTATLSSAIVGDEDGATVTYTVTLSTAPTVDETFTFDVDGVSRSITVAAGQTTGITTVAYTDADVFIDVETVGIASNFAASDADGASNYESLSLTNNATGETLADSIDAVTVVLTATASTGEDGGSITYTASLEDGDGNAVTTANAITVTLANGETITIAADASSGDSAPVAVNRDDVYLENDAITNSIASVSEANAGSAGAFENLGFDATAVSTTITDDSDAVTVVLTATASTGEDGGSITYTASLEDGDGNAVTTANAITVTLANGETITIAADASSGDSAPVAVNRDDVYLENDAISNQITSVSEANAGSAGAFENLGFDATAVSTTITDDSDAVTVVLSSNDTLEGSDITITASVANAPQNTDLVITLDSGDEITIAVGQTTGSVTFTNRGSAGDTITYAISNASGGNYEGLDTSDTVDVAITEPLSALASNVAVDEDVLTDGVADNESSTSQIRVSGGAGDIVSAVIDSQTSSNGVWTVSDSGLVTYTLGSAYSHNSGRGENTRESVDSVTVIVTDSDGNTARVTLGADITDAVSSATDDAVSVDSGSTVSGNVTTNDDFGADGRDGGITGSGGVVFVGTSTSGTGGTGAPIAGDYGTLTLNADGTYTYVADGNQTSDVTDTFYYTIKDSDGDESQAELVISISASDLSSSVDRDVTTYDAGLTSTAGTSIGTATVTATGGSGSYTYAFADGAVTSVDEGDFTIDSSTGVVTFTQDTAYSHATGSGTADDVYSIDVVITDSDGNTVTQTVNLDIWDDEPSAAADTASVTEGASITGGDVLSNDDAGGDGFASSTVVGVGRSSGATGSVGSSVAGTYGTLTLNADGSYDYVSTAGTGGGVDTFYYTVTDADGDTSETTLTITVAATDLSSSVDRDVTTYDAGLTSTAGTSIGTATVTATGGSGSYTYAFADGAVTSVDEGDFTIDSSTGVVTFTQDTAYSHAVGSGTADDVYSIDVVITDSDGNTVTQTVNLDIWDDEPSSVDDAVSVDSGSTVSGNVTTNDDFGADGRDSGSTGGVVFVGTSTSGTGGAGDPITGDYGTLTLNEDGTYTYVADGNQTSDVTDTFYYTIKDSDGDESQAELVISISASDLSSSVDRDVTTYDAGLTSTAGTSIGTATVTATGGSGSYTYAFADGAVTSVDEGDFTIDSSTGVVTFTQDTAYSHATGSGTADDVYSIDVVITDSDGNTVTQTVNLDIWDDEPSAAADTASVTEGASITGGDVLSNDDAGGDGFASSTVVGVGRSSGATGSVGSSVAGTYGTLTLNADGSYDYVSTAGTGGGVDTFYYTVTDADDDTSETTLTITVAATDLSSSVDRDVTTYDAGLTSTAGTSIGTATVTATGGSGSYTYAFADGAVTSVDEGDFTIDSSTGVVTFTQDTAYSHAVGSGTADDVYSIDVVITDSDGNTVTQTVNLDIWDDEPEFTSVTDGDNDGIVELFAPNVGATYAEQFADWNFGGDGSGITTPSLSSVTGNISVVTAAATQIVAQLLDDSGDVAAILTLNANGNDSLEVIEREPETVTVELLTSLAEPGGPVGSVEIATSEITVLVTGDNGDATPNDPSNDTVNTSNNGWGVQNQNLDPFESLTFDFGSSAVSDFQFDTTKFTGGGGSTRNLKVEVTYSDGSTDLFYVSSSQDATVHLSQLSGFDSTKEVSSVTVINDGPGSLNLNNITVDVESTDPVADLSFEFTLGAGAIEDADGDVASRVFNIELSGSSAGAFSSGSTAPVAIDLDGDGVEYLSRDDGVTFTDQESGVAVETAWVASDDGLLVIDANDSGTVDSSSEYVFTEWSDAASSDLEAIAEVFDTNQDGVLDANDERFDQFAVWQDRDSDGVTDADELTSLSDLGIESIELTYREDSASRIDGDGDVTVLGQANVNFEDGSTTTAEDVSFAVEAGDLLSEEDDLAELLSDSDSDSDGDAASIRDNAAAIDTAQLELTLNFEHQESDSFDQHD